jgi:hypothetical protein
LLGKHTLGFHVWVAEGNCGGLKYPPSQPLGVSTNHTQTYGSWQNHSSPNGVTRLLNHMFILVMRVCQRNRNKSGRECNLVNGLKWLRKLGKYKIWWGRLAWGRVSMAVCWQNFFLLERLVLALLKSSLIGWDHWLTKALIG